MSLRTALTGVRRLLLDTAPVIYFLERHSVFGAVMEEFFRVRDEFDIVLVTTPVTVAECLVLPFQQGRGDLVQAYLQLLTRGEGAEFPMTWGEPRRP